jgi:opacity protein-like surface antigen
MTEVSRISKGVVAPTAHSVNEAQPIPARFTMDRRLWFSLCAGLGAPVGEFGKTSGSSGGAANFGFTLGGELSYALNRSTAWVTSLYYSTNSIDESALGLPSGVSSEVGSWTMFWPMTGMRVSSSDVGDLQFYGLAQVGLLAASSPEIKASGGNVIASQSSSTATSVSFSVGAGVISASRLTFWARYITGEPEYEYTAAAIGPMGSYSYTVKGKQPTSLFMIGLGYMF